MENVTPEDIEKAGQAMNDLVNQTMTILESTTDMSREEILKQFQQELLLLWKNCRMMIRTFLELTK